MRKESCTGPQRLHFAHPCGKQIQQPQNIKTLQINGRASSVAFHMSFREDKQRQRKIVRQRKGMEVCLCAGRSSSHKMAVEHCCYGNTPFKAVPALTETQVIAVISRYDITCCPSCPTDSLWPSGSAGECCRVQTGKAAVVFFFREERGRQTWEGGEKLDNSMSWCWDQLQMRGGWWAFQVCLQFQTWFASQYNVMESFCGGEWNNVRNFKIWAW